ncbi:hypothetical protein Poli38472_012789 [Pythium oligandrum]|uniref:Uncharacterized protein n=1 Tax=Pythium oligandrum TaxID=41045 RepID=A0A8K1CFI0_PYTOL|nr:hypothetical protein Poli38472_012789 [Pythium oligandrum]|eukprot:TMW61598.1 hypothetical protein Poli38472_012789 [Pythium oligandrum]
MRRLDGQTSPQASTLPPRSSSHEALVTEQHALRQAAVVLLEVLCNVSVSLTYAAIALYSCTTVNVFSTQSPREQSYASFAASNTTWNIFYCKSSIFLSQVLLLTGQTFEIAPEKKASFFFCFRRVLRAVWR